MSQVAEFYASFKANTADFDKGAKNVKSNLEGMKGGFKEVGLSSVASFLSVGGAITGTVAAIKNASDVTLAYAREVRDLSAASGATAEESSRLLQVLDDYELSAQDVTAATRFLTKNGLAPTMETVAQLSDQYNSLNTAQEKNKFILDNLGRGGMQWVNVLKQGGDALRAQAGDVNKNLILTEKQIEETERYRLAIDNVKDSIEGWKVAAVTSFLDMKDSAERNSRAVAAVADAHGLTTEQVRRGMAASRDFRDAIEGEVAAYQRTEQYGLAWSKALQEQQQATDKAGMSTEELSAKMDLLSGYMSTDLTDAQQSYNEKIAEYKKQLEEARTAEDKMGIQEKIDAETEAYQRRANAIMFNIAQEQVLNSDLGAEDKSSALSTLAESYGLIDASQKHYIDSTATLVSQLESGQISLDQFNAMMVAQAQGATAAAQADKDLGNKLVNLNGRVEDAANSVENLKVQNLDLVEATQGATGASSGLAVALHRMPPDGTEWNYQFNITTTGKVPKLPQRGTNSGPGAGYSNNAGDSETGASFDTGGKWAGGQLGSGWTFVGDAPGGALTPYTEVISPTGYVYSAKDTRELMRHGLLRNAAHHYLTGEGPVTWGGTGGSTTGGGTTTTRRSTTTDVTPRPRRVRSEDVTAAAITPMALSNADTGAPNMPNNSALSAVAQAQDQTTNATNVSNKLLADLNAKLSKLIAITPDVTEQAKATAAASSKYS